MFSSFISALSKQRAAVQNIIATIPFLIYFSDEFFSIMLVRGSYMEPTIHDGDIVLIRKRDAGQIILNVLYSIGYLKPSLSSSNPSDSRNNPMTVDDSRNTASIATNQLNNFDDDHKQALRYRLENINVGNRNNPNNSIYWLISPSYMSPLILPGHVVAYQNPFQFQKPIVERVIGVGGQRIATTSNKGNNNDMTTTVLPNDVLLKNTNQVDENNYSIDHDATTNIASDLLQLLHRRQQQRKELSKYYDLRLPPHYFYTEKDNVGTNIDDSSYLRKDQPVSQNLVMGIAEYIIWPPSRFQRIERKPVYETIHIHKDIHCIARPRAIWD